MRLCIAVWAALLVLGCESQLKTAEAPAGDAATQKQQEATSQDALLHGYALLHDVAAQNKDVGMILLVKPVGKPTKRLIEDIARQSRAIDSWLQTLRVGNERVQRGVDGLPPIESDARRRITKQTTGALLTARHKRFEVHLLVTQEKSTSYMAALSRALSEAESTPERKDQLERIATACEKLNARVLDRLTELAEHTEQESQP